MAKTLSCQINEMVLHTIDHIQSLSHVKTSGLGKQTTEFKEWY